MIKYLEFEEKQSTKNLYLEAFPEDKDTLFVDYYYREKIKDNEIIVEEDEGKIITMIHLNPYIMKICNSEYNIDYIVAVATKTSHRKQGKMANLMKQTLIDMYDDERPFTFLLPANPNYYRGLGFSYISKYTNTEVSNKLKVKKLDIDELIKNGVSDNITNITIVKFMNSWLEKNSEVYCVRSLNYLDRLCEELKTEDGSIEVFLNEVDEVVGIKISWGTEKKEIREFMCDTKYGELKQTDKEYIMARIVNLDEFIQFIKLREDSKRAGETYKLRIKDDIIKDNEGTYLWHINRETSYLERLENEDTLDLPEYDIAEFTSWLFGHNVSYKADFCSDIKTLEKVFITEVV
jgi:hypothetical protein